MLNKLKKIYFDARNILRDYYLLEIREKKRPMTDREKELVDEFRNNVNNISTKGLNSSWNDFARKLRFYVKYFNPRNFLRWSFISLTMAASSEESLKNLKNSPEWERFWRMGIKEDLFGNPVVSSALENSSGALIAHNHHVYRLRERTKMDFSSIESIVEFGGGYGSMCRLFRRFGFTGEYVIFDLPEFSLLQKFFLKGIGLSVEGRDYQPGQKIQNILLDEIGDLDLVLKKIYSKKKLFIATWSLSETPVDLRDKILPMFDDFDYFLIGFQGNFDNIDNKEYFRRYSEQMPGITWSLENIDFWNGYYLIGKKL